MNHDPFDEHLSRELWSLVADADPRPTLRPAAPGGRVMPRPFILIGSVAAAVAVIAALLVAPGGGGGHRQHVAAEGGTPTTTENGIIVATPGDQATPAKIGLITPSGQSTEVSTPAAGRALTAGPDGALWFTAGPQIGRITTAGSATMFPIPDPGQASGIARGSDGNLWFAAGAYIGRI